MPLIPEDPTTGKIGETAAGHGLFVNHAEQGRFYWSNAVTGGVQVWFPAQVPAELLQLAMEAEEAYAAGATEGAPD